MDLTDSRQPHRCQSLFSASKSNFQAPKIACLRIPPDSKGYALSRAGNALGISRTIQ